MAQGARRLAAAALVLLAGACSSGGSSSDGTSGDDDPLAPVPTTVSAAAAAAAAASGYAAPTSLGTLPADVNESSGIVASRRTPGTFWTHNDSGDGPLIYCLGAQAAPCGVWRVTGAEAHDWEDLAAGPGPVPNTPYLYVGDIGDNLSDRSEIVVYRVPEPALAAGGGGAPTSTRSSPGATERAEALRLRYPDGAHNAEALLVHPATGDLYVVVKESGPGVYVARAPLTTGAATTMTKVATLSSSTFASQASQVTGGDISPDGRRVALCNYVEGLELRLPDGTTSFDAVWQQPAVPINVGLRQQGEAIAYRADGKALLTTSEDPIGLGSPLYETVQAG